MLWTVPQAVFVSKTSAFATGQHVRRTKTAALAHNRLNRSYGYVQRYTAYRKLHMSVPVKADPPLSSITVIAHRGSNTQPLMTPKNKTGSYSPN